MCFSSITGAVINVSAANTPAVFTIGGAEADAGETVSIDIKYSSAEEANLIAMAAITLSSADAQIVGFEFSDSAKAVINTGLSNYDPDTKSIITLFNNAQTFDGVLGTLQVKVSDNAADGVITITAGSMARNEGVGEVASSVENGTITVGDVAPAGKPAYTIGNAEAKPGETINVDIRFASDKEVNLIALGSIALSSSDAEIVGFAFSDEAKAVINTALSNYDADTKSIITLFNNAQTFDGVLGTLQIKVSEYAANGDITIRAFSRVQNEGVGVYESEVVAGKITVAKEVVAEKAKYTIGNVEETAGEIAEVPVTFTTTQPVNLTSFYSVTLGSSDAEIVGFEFSDAAKAVINTGLSNYDPDTKSVITLFNAPQTFDGVLGTLKIKVSENAPTCNIAITATSNATNEGVGPVETEVIAGNIAVTAKAPTLEGAEFVIGNAEAVAGDTVDVAINFKTEADVNLIAISEITFDSANAEIVEFEFTEVAKNIINTDLSNYDPATKSIIVLFNNAQPFDGVLGTLKVKVAENAPTGDIAITAGSMARNEGVGDVTSKVTDGKIAVTEKAVELEGAEFVIGNAEAVAGDTVDVAINFATDTPANLVAISAITFDSANAEITGFEFSDAAKAVINTALSNYDPATKSIVALFNQAQTFDGILGTLKVKVADAAPTGDIAITAGSSVQNENAGEGEKVVTSKVTAGKIAVTEKAPVGPEVIDIYVDKYSIEVPFAKSGKIAEYIKENIDVKLIYDNQTDADADKAKVKVELGEGKVTVSVEGYDFTKEVTYTIGKKILMGLTSEKSVSQTFEWNEEIKDEYAFRSFGKITARYEFDNDDGYIEEDATDIAIPLMDIEERQAKVRVLANGEDDYHQINREFIILSAPGTVSALGTLAVPFGTEDVADYVRKNANIKVAREDGTDYPYKAEEIKIEVNGDKTQATISFVGKQLTPVVVTLTKNTFPEGKVVAIKAEPASVDVAWDADEAAIIAAAKENLKVTATYENGVSADLDAAKYTVAYKDGNVVVSCNENANITATITVNRAAVPVAGIEVLPEELTFDYGTEVTADLVKGLITSVNVVYADDSRVGTTEYVVTVDGDVATVTYAGEYSDTIAITINAAPQTGIVAEPAAVEVPYGTKLADVAKAIADAIKVYPTYADGSKGEATNDFGVEINGREDTATITTGNFETTVAVTYATQDAKLIAPARVSVPYNKHNEKSNAEIADYIKDKIDGQVKYVDIYGEEFEAADTYIVTYADEKATVSYEGLEAEITVKLAKKTNSSTSTGTVVRPGDAVITNPEIIGIDVKADAVEIAEEDKDNAEAIEAAVKDAITSVTVKWSEGKADTAVAVDKVTITVDTANNKATVAYEGFEDVVTYTVKSSDAPSTDLPYTDVEKDDWAYDAIKGLSDRGIINGDYGNTLRPGFGITREEVAKVVLKAKGIEVDETLTLNVTDPESVSDWATGYVATAMKEGIIKGYEDGTVKGNKIVTRAELAAIIVRSINATSEVKSSSFADVTEADWFFAEVECAKQLGIINGYEDNTFRGNNDVTRREAFAMVYRMVTLIEALQQ